MNENKLVYIASPYAEDVEVSQTEMYQAASIPVMGMAWC